MSNETRRKINEPILFYRRQSSRRPRGDDGGDGGGQRNRLVVVVVGLGAFVVVRRVTGADVGHLGGHGFLHRHRLRLRPDRRAARPDVRPLRPQPQASPAQQHHRVSFPIASAAFIFTLPRSAAPRNPFWAAVLLPEYVVEKVETLSK